MADDRADRRSPSSPPLRGGFAIPGWVPAAALALAAAGCSDSPAAPGGGGDGPSGNIAAGHAAFVKSCAGCHSSRDGFDLAFFAYPDSAIVRRAVKHVTESAALDIAAYIRSLGPARSDRNARLFQPGERTVGTDIQFAVDLFGADEWPADLTPAELAAIDPRDVPVAFALPTWSSETNDFDWLPDVPIAEELLDWDPGSPALRSARTYLDDYYHDYRTEDLELALTALRDAVHSRHNPEAPCHGVTSDTPPQQVRACFEALRWIASLAAQHVLRAGLDPVPEELHRAWWDVGEGLRRADPGTVPIDDIPLQRAAWLYVAWVFDPGNERRQAVHYSTRPFADLGLPRHATFHSLRAMVARPHASVVAYDDLHQAVEHAPSHWTYAVLKFGYEHLLARIDSGDWPRDLLYPRQDVDGAIGRARLKVTDPAGLQELEDLADRLRRRILARAGL